MDTSGREATDFALSCLSLDIKLRRAVEGYSDREVVAVFIELLIEICRGNSNPLAVYKQIINTLRDRLGNLKPFNN